MINVIEGVDLIDHIGEYDVILVGANLYGTMNGGFPFDVKRRFPYVHETNIAAPYGDRNRLGTILTTKEDNGPTFCLCYIVERVSKTTEVSYESLEKCLKLVKALFKGKKIATTLLGASRFDGNGEKERILNLFKSIMSNEDVTIYDFEQDSIYRKWRKAYIKGALIKKVQGKNAWKKYLKESKNNLTKKSSL